MLKMRDVGNNLILVNETEISVFTGGKKEF